MAFVTRDADGKINGVFTPRQFLGQEELADNHPDVVAFQNRPAVPVAISNGTALEQRRFEKLAEVDPLKALLFKEGIKT